MYKRKQIYNLIPIYDVSFEPTDASAWVLKMPLSQKSRYFGTCVFNASPSVVYSYCADHHCRICSHKLSITVISLLCILGFF